MTTVEHEAPTAELPAHPRPVPRDVPRYRPGAAAMLAGLAVLFAAMAWFAVVLAQTSSTSGVVRATGDFESPSVVGYIVGDHGYSVPSNGVVKNGDRVRVFYDTAHPEKGSTGVDIFLLPGCLFAAAACSVLYGTWCATVRP
ncbi:MAG: hypothetical protein QM774_06635 [Gordonia sp. (in: high G+C Gram-positive bacteria)]|uniref:hypothetical protein n=1 Tax=Gordonia sp. (in: high G+C Gram-positive bacteria) TaxID=84139 RepID=UPI0039E6C5F8